MKKWVEIDFEVGEFVYLITDPDQHKRVVCGIILRPTGLLYEVCHSVQTTIHYGFELSKEKDYKTKEE